MAVFSWYCRHSLEWSLTAVLDPAQEQERCCLWTPGAMCMFCFGFLSQTHSGWVYMRLLAFLANSSSVLVME